MAGLHGEGVHVVPMPCQSPPLFPQSHASCGTHSPLEKQHAPSWHGGGHGLIGVHELAETCTHPPGHGTIAWQLPVAGSQHTPVGAPQEVGVQVEPVAIVPPLRMHSRTRTIVHVFPQQHGTIVKLVPHAATGHDVFGMNVPEAGQPPGADIQQNPASQHAPNVIDAQLAVAHVEPKLTK